MGSSGSKRKVVKVKEIGIDEFYERILRETQPVAIDIFDGNRDVEGGFELGNRMVQSKYLINRKDSWGLPFLVDQCSGSPILVDLRKGLVTSLCFPVASGARVLLTSNDSLFIVSSKSVLQVSFPKLKQIKFQPMIMERENFSLTTFETKLLVTGGNIKNAETNTCELFDGETWTQISALNESRSWHSSIEHLGSVYVFGGFRTNTIEKLEGKWRVLQVNLPLAINRIGLSPLSDRILVVGGEVIGQGFSVNGWEFNTQTEGLLPIKNVNFQAFFYNSGSFFDGISYLIGSGMMIAYDPHYKIFTLHN